MFASILPPISGPAGRRLPEVAVDGSMRRDCARSLRGTVEVAITDAAYRALPSGETPGSDEDTAPPVYFLLHMPRTGGTTIAAHLKAHLGDRICATVRPSPLEMLGRRRVRISRRARFPPCARGHRALSRALARTAFSGAGDPPHLAAARPDRISRLVLQLPHDVLAVARRSDLRFRAASAYPATRSGAADAALHWLEMPLRTILATGDARKYELLNESLAGFWFIGSYEDGDRLLAAVAADLGIPTSGGTKKHDHWSGGSGSAWRPLRPKMTCPTRMREAILAKNPIHDALWHGWRDAGFGRHRPEPARSPPSHSRSSPGGSGRGGGHAAANSGFWISVRSALADRFIAPIWRRISWASRARELAARGPAVPQGAAAGTRTRRRSGCSTATR